MAKQKSTQDPYTRFSILIDAETREVLERRVKETGDTYATIVREAVLFYDHLLREVNDGRTMEVRKYYDAEDPAPHFLVIPWNS